MRLIQSSVYDLGDSLHVLIGLKSFESLTFKTIVCLLSGSEQVSFFAEDWITFINIDLSDYFLKKEHINMRIPKIQILFYEEKKQIVLKCLRSWNTVKINYSQYSTLKTHVILINKKIYSCLEKENYISFQVQFLKEESAKESFINDTAPSLLPYTGVDEEIREALIVFGKEIKNEIISSIDVLQQSQHVEDMLKSLDE